MSGPLLLTLAKGNPDDDEDDNCTKATAAKFRGAPTGNKSTEKIVHSVLF